MRISEENQRNWRRPTSPAAFLGHGTGVRIPVAVPTFAHDPREGLPTEARGEFRASEGGLPVRSLRATVGKPAGSLHHQAEVVHRSATREGGPQRMAG